MSAMSELHAKAEEFKSKLSTEAAHLVDEFEQLVHDLLGQGETDAKQLATDAEHAAAPVVAEAEQDAKGLEQTAAADVTTQSAPAAAPGTTPQA